MGALGKKWAKIFVPYCLAYPIYAAPVLTEMPDISRRFGASLKTQSEAGTKVYREFEGLMATFDDKASTLSTYRGKELTFLIGQSDRASGYAVKKLVAMADGSMVRTEFRAIPPDPTAMAVKVYHGSDSEVVVRQSFKSEMDDRLRFILDRYEVKDIGPRRVRIQKEHRDLTFAFTVDRSGIQIQTPIDMRNAFFKPAKAFENIVQAQIDASKQLHVITVNALNGELSSLEIPWDAKAKNWDQSRAVRTVLTTEAVSKAGILAEVKTIPGRKIVPVDSEAPSGMHVQSPPSPTPAPAEAVGSEH